ncbi:filamentous hemagglutinin N-terminal domain-containing protein [Pseudomonas sp. CCC3.2]|uniref:two-partner secretion domain-containing protein n=1 Tax=unclassified Pseudomonas TaxID=196821 RepID=UPI002AB4B832|nr:MULTISPECIES: filamentous hemagglutinin N-terminal domain-containing protein [unclassified Pseudomonas]MDY7560905.1 filamentous hemagglutinin N-terminal domain-containing protein [Pseudomonas sp. AB6]MEB0181891.1 filamentous hemagglutinin N-terminal domain-containing protein [Pseudomonas sp. CCC3.2]MEB0210070.1 filamentous hemagglutinin N-terminal domain-containing protein [Pseudomonas sp. AB6]
MDVHQYAFLARQSSAEIAPRKHFWGMSKRGIALILANAMFWQPLLAQADGITVSAPGITLGQAGNGVPIVNIAAPNGSGLSHNQFQDYNVGAQGLILNNGTNSTQSTQLGGIILGNPNFHGSAASTILNEVNGGNPSQLNGYTEVAGQSAHVIVANPYGVSCNGCGFINSPQVTLSTGKPILDGNGKLDHYQVDGGSVTLDGAGLNATNIDRFEIVTRSAKLNAELHAKQLTIITGRNDVDAQTLAATPRSPNPADAPALAIDSSALGGMYAGAIKLVGTEAGVGVRLAGNLAASAGDIQLDVNGHLSLAQTAASGAVNVKAASLDATGPVYAGSSLSVSTTGDLNVQQNLAARNSISLSSGGQLTNLGIVEAGVNADNSRNTTGDVSVVANSFNNGGSLIASRNLQATVAQTLFNQGATISGQGSTQITAGTLDNQNNGRVLSNGGLNLNVAGLLNNQNGLLNAVGLLQLQAGVVLNNAGRIASQSDLTANIGALTQQAGQLVAQGNLVLTGATLDNSLGGLVGATKALNLAVGTVDNRGGEISSQVDVTVIAQHLNNSNGGKLLAGTALGLTVDHLINQNKGLIIGATLGLAGSDLDNTGGTFSSKTQLALNLSGDVNNSAGLLSSDGVLTVNAANLNNSAGSLSSGGALTVAATGGLNNQGGSISTDAGLILTSASLDNRNSGVLSGKGATRVSTAAFDNSHGGRLTSANTLILNATNVINQDTGRIASAMALTAYLTGLDQQGGELFSNTSLSLDLNHGQLNNQGGLINAPGALLLKNLNGVANQNGEISSAQAFTLDAQSLDNSNGKVLSNQALTLRLAQAMSNIKGLISAAALDAHSASLDNTDGLLSSHDGLTLSVDGALVNHNGTVIADGNLLLNAATADNSLGEIAGKKDVIANIGSLQQQGGQLIAQGALSLTGDSLDNRQKGLVGATSGLNLTVGNIDNRGGEISSQGAIGLTGQQLDNSDGGHILGRTSLSLAVDNVINRNKGLLSGNTGLSLTGTSLDNGGGSVQSLHSIDVNVLGTLDNSLGLFSSEGTLGVRVGALINSAGSLSSAGVLSVNSTGAVHNQGGQLVTDGSLDLHSVSLDNSQHGSISGKGPLLIQTGAFDNRHGGRVSSADSLDLTAAQLTNQDGGSIGSNHALTASVTGLDQQNGSLFSNTALTLDLNHGQLNNQGGLINAPGPLQLKNLNGVANQGGEISSAQAFNLTAQTLDNSNGKLLSNQSLTLRINQALSNITGMIAAAGVDASASTLDNSGGTLTSRGDLALNVTGSLTNQSSGLINAAQAFNVGAANINNQAGLLLAGTTLTLNAANIDNSANGLINSQGSLLLTANSLNSNNGGEVSAKGNIGLNLSALTQNGGRLLSDAGITLDLGSGDIANQGGLITAKGPLTLSRLRDLNNLNGEISSSQSFNLSGRTLDNTNGKLISSNLLGLNAIGLINQNGLISGWQGLTVSGGSLDNRNNGTLSSRSGDVGVTLSGALLNSNNGALVSHKALTVSTASLDNSGGILSSGSGQILTVSGLLNNGQHGLIDSGAALIVQAMTLGNAAGVINAQQNLSFTGSDLDNSGGTLASNAAVTLDLLGALTNTNGKLASAGALLVQRASQINNQGGQLASQSLMTLLTGGLNNSNHGTVAASGQLLLTATGAVQNNADGLIYSQNADVQLHAASLANGKGALQSQGALGLTVTGDIDNQSGRIIAQNGDLTLNANNVDSRGGVLSSLQGAFTAHLTGVLKNGYDLNNNRQGGITQAQNLSITALGGIDNYGGRISAQTGDALITTGNFDNRNGGLYAKGKINLTGNTFDNSGDNDGQIAGSQIDLTLSGALNNRLGIIESDNTLNITAASLDNQTGKLRALGTSGATRFQIGNLFDNRNGTVESANSDLILAAGSFQNTGGTLLHVGTGTFDLSMPNVTNAGGSIVTRGGLTLNADTWTNSSVIQAGRLTVNVNNFTQTAAGQLLASGAFVGTGGNWSNDGLIASSGSLSLILTGTYGGNGEVSSVGSLGLSAGQIDLSSVASITAGTTGVVSSSGSLNNFGRLTSAGDLTVNAASLNNQGTLGSAAALRVNASTILNQNGLIFSGGDMALRTDNFTNRYADIYSLGNISIAKDDSNGWSSSIANVSATIESVGDLSLAASHIENRKDVFETTGGLVSSAIGVGCYTCEFVPSVEDEHTDGHIVWVQNYQSTIVQDSASASLTAGRNMLVSGTDLLNSDSTISAGNNLTLNLTNFTNQGASVGDYSVKRTYAESFDNDIGFWIGAMQYNSVSDPNYDANDPGPYDSNHNMQPPKFEFWNKDGVQSLTAMSGHFLGRDHQGFSGFGTIRVENDRTIDWEIQAPNYQPGVQAPVPVALLNATPVENTVIYNNPSSYANAVVQAGGTVSITASQNLTNSVVREGVVLGSSASRVGSTQISGQAAPTIVNLNAQLPPDLAQQQVNPLTLPGFSLPTGQNGLFRLSGQGGSTVDASQTSTAPQSWTLGGANVSLAQRDQTASDTQGRGIQPGNVSQASSASQQLAGDVRQGSGVSGSASAINVGATNATSGAQTVARAQGIPTSSSTSQPQKYRIETNPALTDLKQFMSSDYLLAGLGYNPDDSAKRLGDGLYEQRLIEQAIVARTGQAFIDGQTSNEAQLKYLMDNAIASKNALNLSVGVSLTSEQVAALTHDIVWMESEVVDGQTVLVPVLYLAQANNRLAPNGALIQGSDVTLIAGKNLDNAGTLKATNNLAATAGNDLVNSGLVSAGSRLSLLAGNDLTNKAGGIIAGRDVSITAVSGDVLNERTVTKAQASNGYVSTRYDFADSAGRIEAANDLTIQAGRDVNNIGGVLQSGRDTTISAGRDVNLVSAQTDNKYTAGSNYLDQHITQLSDSVSAGRDLSVTAGRDVTAVASQIDAKRNITMAATENLTLGSAADEDHFDSKSRHVTEQKDHVSQVATTLNAGGDVVLSSGQDMTLVSSKVTAGNEAYLVAGGQLSLLAAQDSDYSLYDMKKKGGWGSKRSRKDETTQVTNVGSEISTGGDLVLLSGGDQLYQAAKLNSGNDLTINSGGSVTFQGVKDFHQEDHEKSSSDMAWMSMSGKGSTDQTLRQSELTAKGQMTINAVNGLNIDIRQINQNTVSQTIDAMVQADPQLAWLKEADKRGDVDWRQVQEIHDSFKYSSSGLGVAAQLVIAILLAAFLGPAVAGMAGGETVGAVAGAVASSAATNATISFIDNRGNLAAVVKDVTSSDALKGYVVSGVTAGLTFGLFDSLNMTTVSNGKVVLDVSSLRGIGGFATNQVLQSGTAAILEKALGENPSFSRALTSALLNTVAATSFNAIGDLDLETGSLSKAALHALAGGLISQAAGGDFAAGAIAAGATELFANQLRQTMTALSPANRDLLLTTSSQLLGVITAAIVSPDADGNSAQTAAWIAANAMQYNNLNHDAMSDFVTDMNACAKDEKCQTNTWVANGFGKESAADYENALKIGGLGGALAEVNSIKGGLLAIQSLECTTEICAGYKSLLLQRAADSLNYLATVVTQWEPLLNVGAIGASGTVLAEIQELKGLAVAKPVSTGAKGGSAVADDFFAGTKYTDKVLGQIKTGDLHGFPESVTTFQGAGQVTKITGGDGVVRDMLKIPGEYRGKQGVFEFIKESDGSINHRLFKPTSAE